MTAADITITLNRGEAEGLLAAALKGADDPEVTDNMTYADVQALNRGLRILELLVTYTWGDKL